MRGREKKIKFFIACAIEWLVQFSVSIELIPREHQSKRVNLLYRRYAQSDSSLVIFRYGIQFFPRSNTRDTWTAQATFSDLRLNGGIWCEKSFFKPRFITQVSSAVVFFGWAFVYAHVARLAFRSFAHS